MGILYLSIPLFLNLIFGNIKNEWESAINDWNPSLKDMIEALSSYVSGISAAKARCGISNKVTKNLVRTAKIKSQKNKKNCDSAQPLSG